MERIRTDSRTRFSDISRTVQNASAPVLLTVEGGEDLVIMSAKAFQAFEDLRLKMEIERKLLDSEREEEQGAKWYTPEEVFSELRRDMRGKQYGTI